MKVKVKKRYYENNRGEIFIQRAYTPWWVYVNPLLWLFAGKLEQWEDEELLDNKVYRLEEQLNKLANQARKTIKEREEALRQLEIDRREIKNSHSTRKGYSEPWYEKGNYFPAAPVFLNPPPGDWRAAFSNKLLSNGDSKKSHIANAKEKAGMSSGGSDPFMGPPTKAVVLKEHQNIHFSGDFDSLDTVDGSKNQGGKGQNKGSWRNRRKGESDQEYQERLAKGPNG